MRTTLKGLLYGTARAFGAPAVLRSRGAGPILCYHNVVDGNQAATGEPSLHIAATDFESHVQRLQKHYDLVALADYAERLASPKGARGLAALTFDDAYAGVLAHAVPRLAAFGVPSTIFVVAEAPGRPDAFWWDDAWITASERDANRERWLSDLQGRSERIRATYAADRALGTRSRDATPASWQALTQAASEGQGRITLGVHSATHPALDAIDGVMLDRETAGARTDLMARLPGAFDAFAYPYGRWNSAARDAVRRAGHKLAVTLDPGRNEKDSDPLALKRINVPAGLKPDALELWAAGWRP